MSFHTPQENLDSSRRYPDDKSQTLSATSASFNTAHGDSSPYQRYMLPSVPNLAPTAAPAAQHPASAASSFGAPVPTQQYHLPPTFTGANAAPGQPHFASPYPPSFSQAPQPRQPYQQAPQISGVNYPNYDQIQAGPYTTQFQQPGAGRGSTGYVAQPAPTFGSMNPNMYNNQPYRPASQGQRLQSLGNAPGAGAGATAAFAHGTPMRVSSSGDLVEADDEDKKTNGLLSSQHGIPAAGESGAGGAELAQAAANGNLSAVGKESCAHMLLRNNRQPQIAMFVLFVAGIVVTITTANLESHLSVGLLWGSALSVLCCLAIIVTFYTRVPWRRHPNSLILFRAYCDLIFCLILLIINTYTCVSNECSSNLEIFNRTACTITAGIIEFTILASESWFFAMVLDLYLSLKSPFTNHKRNMRFYHLYVWSVSIAMAIFLMSIADKIGPSDIGDTCWTEMGSEDLKPNKYSWAFFYAWLLGYYLIGIIVYLWASWRLNDGLQKTLNMRRRVLSSVAFYVRAILVYWLVVGGFYIAYLQVINRPYYRYNDQTGQIESINQGNDNNLWLKQLLTYLVTAKGYVDFIIWFSINDANNAGTDVDLNPQLNTALRSEIRYYTTNGIIKAVQNSKDLTENVSYNEIYLEKQDSDTSSSSTIASTSADDSRAHSHRSSKATLFTDYLPLQFRRVRQLCNINDEEFCQSISFTTKERISEGASGAFMFFSQDQNYIVKSLSAEESKFLQSIAKDYANHLEKNPRSLLIKFYGCHSIRLYSQTFYFVVMGNVFDPKKTIHNRYDIKGSYVNRTHKTPKVGALVTCRHCNAKYRFGVLAENFMCEIREGMHEPDTVLKDNDLTSIIRLDRDTADRLYLQLVADTSFLKNKRVMDYSLLVGVFNVPYAIGDEIVEAMTAQETFSSNYPGYLRAATVIGPKEYYFGLIDILQQWTFQKKLERFFKVYFLRKDGDGLSAMPPEQFWERYCERVGQILGLDYE